MLRCFRKKRKRYQQGKNKVHTNIQTKNEKEKIKLFKKKKIV